MKIPMESAHLVHALWSSAVQQIAVQDSVATALRDGIRLIFCCVSLMGPDDMAASLLLIDFGSTFTKVTAVDRDDAVILGRAQSPTTIATDVAEGLAKAVHLLVEETGISSLADAPRLASSSAAGGLRMTICGLVPRLTSEAGRRAALGAGAKVVGVHSYTLNGSDMKRIIDQVPDILLLSGGTDGGDAEVVLANANRIAGSSLECPIIVAANKSAADEIGEILAASGKRPTQTENVMPEFGRLNVEPARAVIREVFIEHITRAKGLDRVQETFELPVLPTPMAVLQAAEVLANGDGNEEGLGELLLVDVGGATTDVDSIAQGEPTEPGVVLRGLPEPYAKRTVEGDLGIRFNAGHILDTSLDKLRAHANVSGNAVEDDGLRGKVDILSKRVETVPLDDPGFRLDTALARTAVEVAVERHAGSIERVHLSDGDATLQHGKDLREVSTVIGTGGVFAYGQNQRYILEGAKFDKSRPLSLGPRNPNYFVDSSYIFYAMGLLAAIEPKLAVSLLKQNLTAA